MNRNLLNRGPPGEGSSAQAEEIVHVVGILVTYRGLSKEVNINRIMGAREGR